MPDNKQTGQGAKVGKSYRKGDVIVNKIVKQTIDRTPKDIGTWRHSHKVAEAIVNPNRSKLYDLYSDVELDGHLSGIVGKRIDAVLNKPIYFENSAGKRVEEMDAFCGSRVFRDILRSIMQAPLWGLSGLEFETGKEVKIKHIPRKHIKPDLGIVALNQSGREGFNYEEHPFLFIIGDPDDLGLYLKCAPYVIYKKGTMADWSQYIEIFGQPVRVIHYDAYDEQTKIQLEKILDESGGSLALMVPNQARFEMHDGKQSNGNGELQEKFKDSLNAEMSILILGNEETTKGGGGSMAKSKTQADQQLEITKSDIIYASNYLNDPKLISILASYGLPVEGGRFVFTKDVDITFLTERMAIDIQAKDVIIIPESYWYNTYGYPEPTPEEKEQVLQKRQKAKPVAKKGAKQEEDEEELEDLNYKQKSRLARVLNFFAQALG